MSSATIENKIATIIMLFSEFVLFTIFVSFIDKWSPQIKFRGIPLSVDYSCVVWLKSHHKRHCEDVRSGVLNRHHEGRLHEDGDFSRLASGLTVHLAKARAAGNSYRWLWIALNLPRQCTGWADVRPLWFVTSYHSCAKYLIFNTLYFFSSQSFL